MSSDGMAYTPRDQARCPPPPLQPRGEKCLRLTWMLNEWTPKHNSSDNSTTCYGSLEIDVNMFGGEGQKPGPWREEGAKTDNFFYCSILIQK